MFGLGFWEIIIIAVLALILLGPDKLPDAARTAGKLMRDLRRATDDIRDQLETEIYADELKKGPAVPPVPASSSRPSGAAPPEGAEGAAPQLPSPYGDLAATAEPPASIEPAPAPPGDPGEAPKA